MSRREVTNPHDKITIDYSDPEAAQIAVLLVGGGAYGIADEMPIFILGGSEEWAQETYGKSLADFADTVSSERVIKALRSMQLEHVRSSMSDPVGKAHGYADAMEAT